MQKIKSPLLVDASRKGKPNKKQMHCNSNTYYFKNKKFNPLLLPEPKQYYLTIFPNLKNNSEWISVICCFHEDKNPSLRINLSTGAFRCFGCGIKGRDVLAFHQQLHQLNFIEAVSLFGAWNE